MCTATAVWLSLRQREGRIWQSNDLGMLGIRFYCTTLCFAALAQAARLQYAITYYYHDVHGWGMRVFYAETSVANHAVQQIIDNMHQWSGGRYYAMATIYGFDVKVITAQALPSIYGVHAVLTDMENLIHNNVQNPEHH